MPECKLSPGDRCWGFKWWWCVAYGGTEGELDGLGRTEWS